MRTHRRSSELAHAVQGRSSTPDDEGYDEARAVYNAMIDRQPDGRSCGPRTPAT